MINSGAAVIYKCRNCGNVKDVTHVPNGFKALQILMYDEKMPNDWGWLTLDKLTTCNCDNKTIGIADFVGVRFD